MENPDSMPTTADHANHTAEGNKRELQELLKYIRGLEQRIQRLESQSRINEKWGN